MAFDVYEVLVFARDAAILSAVAWLDELISLPVSRKQFRPQYC